MTKILFFYDKTTERTIARKRSRGEKKNVPRHFHINFIKKNTSNKIRVCKNFNLEVLNISQKRISYFHQKRIGITKSPRTYEEGKQPTNRISAVVRQSDRGHIN